MSILAIPRYISIRSFFAVGNGAKSAMNQLSLFRYLLRLVLIVEFVSTPTQSIELIWNKNTKKQYHPLTALNGDDESFSQTESISMNPWKAINTAPKKNENAPVWKNKDAEYLKGIVFRCFLRKEKYEMKRKTIIETLTA